MATSNDVGFWGCLILSQGANNPISIAVFSMMALVYLYWGIKDAVS